MSEPFLSGGTGAIVETQRGVDTPVAVNSALSEVGYEGSASSARHSGESDPDTALKKKQNTPPRQRGFKTPTKSRPEDRDAIRRCWLEAKKQAAQMEEAAKTGEAASVAASAFDLAATLDVMWGLRAAHDEDWRGILNFLQGVLKDESFEDFTVDQCAAVKQVIEDYLGPHTIEKDDVRQARRILRRGGFDPWRPISTPEGG
ncbi:MAG TPA: hypothetical protein VEL76_06115 [Gemmataceae bacterium]|nr:hypothetical protein [Gemmataceae bacterium]